MKVKSIHRSDNQSGATMLEFAMIIGFAFALIAGIFDFGITIHKYSLITHTTNTLARKLAIEIARKSGTSCNTIQEDARTSAEEYVANVLNLTDYLSLRDSAHPSGKLVFEARVADEDPWAVEMRAELELNCFFCQMIPKTFTISSVSRAPIERTSFSCT